MRHESTQAVYPNAAERSDRNEGPLPASISLISKTAFKKVILMMRIKPNIWALSGSIAGILVFGFIDYKNRY